MRITTTLTLCFAVATGMAVSLNATADTGVLDLPLPGGDTTVALEESQAPAILDAAGDPLALQEALQDELEKEQDELQELPRGELEERAEQGERAAQITLAEEFAEEAGLLAFAPAAANDALSDAVRWYALAAQRGFPGAPSLDQAGVRFYPIRVQR